MAKTKSVKGTNFGKLQISDRHGCKEKSQNPRRKAPNHPKKLSHLHKTGTAPEKFRPIGASCDNWIRAPQNVR
ncbi:hypothetical protein U9M48_008611 [Paspalum notatum var. saurae]|uniref:Uncharacterized protein n=1 Tax=Paspalum notatum var. saurae TaxID=547442 RepID=A0AAQ3WDV8_PASNO